MQRASKEQLNTIISIIVLFSFLLKVLNTLSHVAVVYGQYPGYVLVDKRG